MRRISSVSSAARPNSPVTHFTFWPSTFWRVPPSGCSAHHVADTHQSAWGILIGIVAAVGMPVLAKYKLKVAAADRLNSKALRADAMEAFTCGSLSIVLIVGLAATRLFGWWWLDSVAALFLIPLLIKEGREAIKGECACCQCEGERT